ncbi:MAG: hypothetical protein A3J24_09910 [Deltaproteobacteria bacterium RIFCSPLOWO2_02_FULL_53_8]|nr:MAG: hypothetical protein A3J24_09910 [Deltaproteobacteria bacterium RIFCSPLOWO2_02_FULL_53_8]
MKATPRKQPNPSKPRGKRLRKKLHINEFQELGFEYEVSWRKAPDGESQITFFERLIAEVITPRGLQFGGGCTVGGIAGHRRNPTPDDQLAVREWIQRWKDVESVKIGPIVDVWYEHSK